jgi:hypothetical protein
MSIVSFGLGKINVVPMGKTNFIDKAFILDLSDQFDPKMRAKFQIGSVDMQMSHNIFMEGT